MKTRTLSVVTILASTLLCACATSGPKFAEMAASLGAAKADMGRIYFYRTILLGAAVQPEVRLNGEVVGKAVPSGFFYVDRPAGNYAVSTVTEVERKLTFTLEAGQVRYVRLNIAMGFFVGHVYGELVDEVQGRAEIADTRYTGSLDGRGTQPIEQPVAAPSQPVEERDVRPATIERPVDCRNQAAGPSPQQRARCY